MFLSRAKAVKAAANAAAAPAGASDVKAAIAKSQQKIPDLQTYLDTRDYLGAVTLLEVQLIKFSKVYGIFSDFVSLLCRSLPSLLSSLFVCLKCSFFTIIIFLFSFKRVILMRNLTKKLYRNGLDLQHFIWVITQKPFQYTYVSIFQNNYSVYYKLCILLLIIIISSVGSVLPFDIYIVTFLIFLKHI